MWVCDKHASSVVAAHPRSDRIVPCLMHFGGAFLAVVCIHAPRIVECSAAHSSFWAQRGEVLPQQPPEAIVVLAGDAND
eukprot:10937598-Alexandrium_andersonii.AAC.1